MSDKSIPVRMAALGDRIDENDGVLTLMMGEVRDAYGAERLGVNVRRGIRLMLQRMGIDWWPETLSNNQNIYIRLYRLGTPVAKVIQAALRPGSRRDQTLREVAASDKAKILQQVRELVCS